MREMKATQAWPLEKEMASQYCHLPWTIYHCQYIGNIPIYHGQSSLGARVHVITMCQIRLSPAQEQWCPCARSVPRSWLTLCDPKDCSLPGSSVHGIFQARILEPVAISPGDLSDPRIEPASPALAADPLPPSPLGIHFLLGCSLILLRSWLGTKGIPATKSRVAGTWQISGERWILFF